MSKTLLIYGLAALVGCAGPQVSEPVQNSLPVKPAAGTLIAAFKEGASNDAILSLIAAGADVNDYAWGDGEDWGFTPLHYAADSRPLAVIKALVDAGADVTAKDGFGDVARAGLHVNDKLSTKEKDEALLLLGGSA